MDSHFLSQDVFYHPLGQPVGPTSDSQMIQSADTQQQSQPGSESYATEVMQQSTSPVLELNGRDMTYTQLHETLFGK